MKPEGRAERQGAPSRSTRLALLRSLCCDGFCSRWQSRFALLEPSRPVATVRDPLRAARSARPAKLAAIAAYLGRPNATPVGAVRAMVDAGQRHQGKIPRVVLLTAMGILLLAHAVAAQNCKKGIRCGNTCISASKVCHIGSSAPAPAPAYTPPPAAPQPLVSNPAAPVTQADPPGLADSDSEFPWLGSVADGVYFQRTCPAAQDLAPANRRYFRTHQEAEGAGFRRSRTPGC
jgi:hypothetical protein